jgi:hypothetical protein
MDLAIQAIPTFGTYPGDTHLWRVKHLQIPSILMTGLARMILLSPAAGLVQVVGIFGRVDG